MHCVEVHIAQFQSDNHLVNQACVLRICTQQCQADVNTGIGAGEFAEPLQSLFKQHVKYQM
jgi:hypothetical protein